jgi:hypothetical protein
VAFVRHDPRTLNLRPERFLLPVIQPIGGPVGGQTASSVEQSFCAAALIEAKHGIVELADRVGPSMSGRSRRQAEWD